MEIEKKYQIKEMPCLDGAMTKEMEQGYLCTDPVVRIRRSNDKYILTWNDWRKTGGCSYVPGV